MHVNKVQRVTTIDRVAADLGESVDWLYDVAMEMDAEDGVIWVYGPRDHHVMAFTDFGIETLIELIKVHRELPSTIPEAGNRHACGLQRMATNYRSVWQILASILHDHASIERCAPDGNLARSG